MVKFKLPIFTSCQTKHSSTSTPPEHPSSPSHRHKLLTAEPPPPSKQPTTHRSSFKTHVSSAFRCGPKSGHQSAVEHFPTHDVVSPRSKISTSFDTPPRRRFPTLENKERCTSHRFRTSYTIDDCGEHEERSESLNYPRRSFSDVGIRSRGGQVSPEWGSPARLSVFKKLMPCKVEGKVKESFAVVKRSEKPYEDFKKSMMEMIVENQIYEESDLKQLLQCFLSLNSCYHHGVIMEAFSEIWNTLFLDL